MKCPFCQSDNLELKQDTQCCEDCGGSFEVVQEPQDILLEDRRLCKSKTLIRWAKENGYEIKDIKLATDYTVEDFLGSVTVTKK